MIFSFLSVPLILDIVCIIHIVKTGRDRIWIYIVLFAPIIGSVAYLITELIPSLLAGRKSHELKQALSSTVFGGKKIAELEKLLRISDTYQNRHSLADAYLEAGANDKAIDVYLSCLSGAYENDPHLLQTIAHSYFLNKEWERSKTYFEKASFNQDIEKKYRVEYAQSLAHTEEYAKAEEQFKILKLETNVEGIFKYAEFLSETGKEESAKQKYKYIIFISSTLPKFVLRENKQWINLAKEAINE